MQVGSSAALSPQLQALGSAALGKYQGGDFSFTVNDGGASGAGSAAASDQLSGSVTAGSIMAVGTFGPNGQMIPFSAAQIQSEESMAANMGQTAFGDSLQNFLALAQAGSSNGEVTASSYKDQQQFTGDNGLVSVSLDTSFTLSPASAAARPGSSSSTSPSVTA